MKFTLPQEIVEEKPQYDAIMHTSGPLMIIAGPGSGKTKVLVWKVVKLLVEDKIPPEQIWITTYTEKASKQLKAKIASVIQSLNLNIQVPKMLIGTIHSTCLQLIKENPEYFPSVKFPVEILDTHKQLLYFLKHSRTLNLDRSANQTSKRPDLFSVLSIIDHINWLTEFEVDPKTYEDYIKKELINGNSNIKEEDVWISKTYKNYLQLVKNDGLLDFAHILRSVSEAISNSNFGVFLSKRIKYILVDEYQDVNLLQQFIFSQVAIAIPGKNITVVGDDDQAIYQFRGAGVGTLRVFDELFKPEKIYLTKNFRSCQKILNAASELISTKPSEFRYEKNIVASDKIKRDNLGVIIHESETLLESASDIAKFIKQLILKGKIRRYGDIVLLMRSIKPNHIQSYITAFDQFNIPYTVVGETGLFSTHIGLSIMSLFSYMSHDTAIMSEQIVHNFIIDLKADTKEAIEDMDYRLKKEDVCDLKINPRDKEVLQAIYTLHNRRGEFTSALDILYEFLRITSFIDQKMKSNDIEALRIISEISAIILEFEQQFSNDIIACTQYMKDLWESGQADLPKMSMSEANYVKIMTVHQAKGLEFPLVILGEAINGRFPSRGFTDDFYRPYNLSPRTQKRESEENEEKRLFYVAMTRARNMLIISTARKISAESRRVAGKTKWLEYIQSENLDTLTTIQNKLVMTIGNEYIYEEDPEVYSFSSLNYYIYCPFRYFILRDICLAFPTEEYFTIGSNVHAVLEFIHTQAIAGKTIKISDVENIVKRFWLNIHESKEANIRAQNSVIKMIKEYIKLNEKDFKYIKDVEKEFWIYLEKGIFTGKIDMIRFVDKKFEIVDFKSGTIESFDYQEQLKTYLMGSIYGLAIKSLKASIHELKNNKITTFEFSEKDIEDTKNRIIETIQKIGKGEFKATPNEKKCQKCELKAYNLCPYSK